MTRIKGNFLILAICAVGILFSERSLDAALTGTDNNHVNDLVGDRAMGLGGAFTAISDDPSGAYYNPAGLSFAAENQISLSVNTYKTKSVDYANAIGSGTTYAQDIESFYPSLFGVVQSFGSLKVAFTFININNEILDQDNTFKGQSFELESTFDQDGSSTIEADEQGIKLAADNTRFRINYNNTDNTLLAGLSVSGFITDSWTWGATLYMLRRRQEQIANQQIVYKGIVDDGSTAFDESSFNKVFGTTTNYITDEIFGINPRIGTQFMPSQQFSIGLSAAFPQVLSHEQTRQDTAASSLADTTDFISDTTKTTDFDDTAIPINVRGGIGWFPSKKLLVTADVIADIGDKNYQRETNGATLNFAAGTEYYLTNSLPVRFGLFTNRSAVPDSSKELQIDLYGISLSLSWQSRSSSITLGGFYQSNFFGDGTAQIVGDSNRVQTVDASIIQFGLTGSAKY